MTEWNKFSKSGLLYWCYQSLQLLEEMTPTETNWFSVVNYNVLHRKAFYQLWNQAQLHIKNMHNSWWQLEDVPEGPQWLIQFRLNCSLMMSKCSVWFKRIAMPSEFSLRRTLLCYHCNCVLSLERMGWAIPTTRMWLHTFDTQSTYSNYLVEKKILDVWTNLFILIMSIPCEEKFRFAACKNHTSWSSANGSQ